MEKDYRYRILIGLSRVAFAGGLLFVIYLLKLMIRG